MIMLVPIIGKRWKVLSHVRGDFFFSKQFRYAHQMIYDSKKMKQFMFGGNPGDNGNPNTRLDDFWELTLVR
jgi:hypothetical protein